MADFNNYAESGIINLLLRTGGFPKPASLAVALCSGVPDDSHNGGNLPEIANANGYARYNLGAPSDAHFSSPGVDGITYNHSGWTWPTNITANWGVISGLAILDNATYGLGAVLLQGSLSVVKTVTVGDVFTISASGCSITVS